MIQINKLNDVAKDNHKITIYASCVYKYSV